MLRKSRHIAKFVLFFGLLLASLGHAQPPKTASLSFSWSTPTGLSVFYRQDYVWIVFDKRQMINLERINKTLQGFVENVLEIPHSKATVLRIKLKDKVTPFVRAEGLLWIIDFIDGKKVAETQIKDAQTVVQYDSFNNAYVFIASNAFSEPISVIDPEIGDILLVSPASQTNIGMLNKYNFIDFNFLKSLQGLAISTNADDLIFIKGIRGLSLKGKNRGLNISKDLEALKRQQQISQESNSEDFKLGLPEGVMQQDYITAIWSFKKDIRNAPAEHKNNARFELAKYYIAKGLGFEAVAVLNTILKHMETDTSKEKIFGLRGVANFLAHRYNEAIEDFSYGKLPQNDNAIFWSNLANLITNPQKADNAIMMAFISVIKDYPQELKDRIALIGAQSAINARDDLTAQNFIDILKLSHNNKRIQPELNYLIAQNFLLQGYGGEAYKGFQNTTTMNSQKFSSFAKFDGALLGYRLKLLKLADTIRELETVKFAWGDKSFKIKVLDNLARLYITKKDYYNALKSMQKNLKLVDNERKEQINLDIITLFENMYIHNQADDISALKSLSLYDEFLSFIKQSKKWTEIVIKVSDRLVAVDLLDKAERILQKEFKNNATSEKNKYKIGTRLALIYIFQENNVKALQILAASENNKKVLSLVPYRNVLKATAYKNTGKADHALEILKDNYSRPALLLKSEIYWDSKDWASLSDTIKYLIDEPQIGKPLNEEQTKYILDWLMALRKSGKDTAIVLARKKFEPFFTNTKYYSTFDVLTQNLDADKIDTKEITNMINNMISYSNWTKAANSSLEKIGK